MWTLIQYNLRSLWRRKSATALTVLAMGATVAVLSGVLALQQGFAHLFQTSGRDGVAVFMRAGANSEGSSMFMRADATRLKGTVNEIAVDQNQQPIAAMECFLAVRLDRTEGGQTNVPIRGVERASFDVYGDVEVLEGRRIELGADEVMIGHKLVGRIAGCEVGDVIQLNTTPLRVVGVFKTDSPFDSEIWGDVERMLPTLNRPGPNRIVARLKPGVDVAELSGRLEKDKEFPSKALTEKEYFANQTGFLSGLLIALGTFLALVMGVAAVFTAVNTMLAAISSRTHEIGILLSVGYRPIPIFLSFLFEAFVIGLLGGIVGCLLVIPVNGIETGTTNFETFTEIAFAFRVTPLVLAVAICFAMLLGIVGGMIPAWKAASMRPTEALRRG